MSLAGYDRLWFVIPYGALIMMTGKALYVRLARALIHGFTMLALASAAPVLADELPKSAPQEDAGAAVDPAWLERMNKDDRAAMDELIGFAPPEMTSDLTWIGAPAGGTSWNDLRGRVVVVQSFTTANNAGRSVPVRLQKSLGEFPQKDVFIIALHTPEGADKAEEFLGKKPAEVPVLVDPKGAFCDALSIYKRPANVVIDRNGAVRYVGLNDAGLNKAVGQLMRESFDLSKAAKPRPVEESSAAEVVEFPSFENKIQAAADLRGKQAPAFFVQKWLTKQPQINGRVVVLDFWATWCPPCRASIPHMNELATTYGDKAAFIGISDEKESEFEAGLKKHKLKPDSFKYSLALDSGAKMKGAVKISAIPHAMVVSSDGIVRWQGHPMDLTSPVVDKIIKADASRQAGGKPTGEKSRPRPSWTGGPAGATP
jgi:cytochrome c biogenesis protein CcmG/thiol:disulfide interchange protein DsbE